ncbi:hypothetical protein [Solidesulfovibrio sp.]
MSRKFRRFLRLVFDNHLEINSNLHFSERSCSFGIERSRGDFVAKFNIDTYSKWPQDKKGEAIFICKTPQSKNFLVILIEIKSGAMDSAFDQIATTASLLKNTATETKLAHAANKQTWDNNLPWLAKQGIHHNKIALGIILSPGGPKIRGLWQSKKKELRQNHNVKLINRQNICSTFTVQQLFSLASE